MIHTNCLHQASTELKCFSFPWRCESASYPIDRHLYTSYAEDQSERTRLMRCPKLSLSAGGTSRQRAVKES